jgi:AraC family transcriptional regulator, alkane utilization regulator
MDQISSLVGRLAFGSRVFFNGSFCDSNNFATDGGPGHLHLVRAGPVVFSTPDGRSFCVEEPAMVFYPCGAAHELTVPNGAQAQLLCARIEFEDGARNLLARSLPGCLYLPLSGLGTISQTLFLLFAEAAARPQGSDVVLDRLCDVLMIQVIRHQFESGTLPEGLLAGLVDRQLAPVLAAIHDHPNETLQLAQMAKLACMSRARFTDHFRSVVGMPPGEYLTRWRITVAQRLLLCGQPVKSVSAQTGYANPASFTRAFTGIVGLSPRHWLRNAAEPTCCPIAAERRSPQSSLSWLLPTG